MPMSACYRRMIYSSCAIVASNITCITVNPAYEYTQNEEICFADTVHWRSNDYFTAGTYYDSLSTQQGCDSVYVLNLMVHPFYFIMEAATVCEGTPFTWRGQTYTLPGVYYDSLLAATGCDSVYSLNLSTWPVFNFVTKDTICEGDTYYWRGNYYNTTGIYTVPYSSQYGCDSIYTLELNLRSLPVVSMDTLPMYCVYNAPVTLSGTPTGGVFTGQGITGNLFSPTTAGIGNWMIVYGFADAHGCYNADTVFITVDACTGITDGGVHTIRLYPNPNDGNLVIDLPEETHITVYDALGSILYNTAFSKGISPLNFSHLANGLYFINAESTSGVKVLKLIIQK